MWCRSLRLAAAVATVVGAAENNCQDPAAGCRAPGAEFDDEMAMLQLKSGASHIKSGAAAAKESTRGISIIDQIISELLGVKDLIKETLPFRQGAGSVGDYIGYIPLFSTHQFTQGGDAEELSKITKVMILVQEYTGVPKQSMDLVYDIHEFRDVLLKPHGAQHSTLMVMPWFPEEEIDLMASKWSNDTTRNWPVLRWADPGTYASGGDSVFGNVSVFAVFDRLVEMMQKDLVDLLPNLKTIDVVGYSGGCKVASRWAFFSPLAMPDAGRARLRTAAGGCSNYMYLDDTRPVESCRVPKGHGGDFTCSEFAVPTDCPNYDNFDKGLGAVPAEYQYVSKIASNEASLKNTIDSFPKKEILYMVGDMDDCNCLDSDKYENPHHCYHPTYPIGCNDVYPDYNAMFFTVGVVGGSCSKNLQGWTRAQRFANYMSHLKTFYAGRGVDYTPKHAFHKGAHTYGNMMRTPDFLEFLGFTS